MTLGLPSMYADALPTSIAKVVRGTVMRGGEPWIPIFCANCGADGGYVPEAAADFAFYLCDPCAEKWSPLVDTMLVPDEIFWKKLHEAQREKYGRLLAINELLEQLANPDSMITKLANDRHRRI